MIYILAQIIDIVFSFYLLVLLGRFVFDTVRLFLPYWTPRGVLLVIANIVYSLTDPPLDFLRRYIPPLRLGGFALDVAFLVLFLGVSFTQRILLTLLYVLVS
ncbi:MAG: YggT family protein [Actinomycetaceae bacterium]|nr:YggT family protein [Actinomycetaceae bacterium]